MTPRELIDHARIGDILPALGIPEPIHGRTCASWRGSADRNISINAEKNVWCDHVRGAGGGVLSLIETALGCNRKTALAWLADHYGVNIDSGMTPAELFAWKQRRERARRIGEQVAAWWKERRAAIIERHNDCIDTDAAICRLVLAALRGETSLSESEWTFLCRYSHELMAEAGQLDAERNHLENADGRELIEMRRQAA